jgi:anti-anti-sigma factor
MVPLSGIVGAFLVERGYPQAERGRIIPRAPCREVVNPAHRDEKSGFRRAAVVEVVDGFGAEDHAPNFQVRTVFVPPRAVIVLSGELDISSIATLSSAIETILSILPAPEKALLDLGALRFADLVGLRALVDACHRLEQLGPVEVYGIRGQVQRVLDLGVLTLPVSAGLPTSDVPRRG